MGSAAVTITPDEAPVTITPDPAPTGFGMEGESLANGNSVPNARLRNLPNPAANEESPVSALYHGAKTGAQLAMLPMSAELPSMTLKQLVGLFSGSAVGGAVGQQVANSYGAGPLGQEAGSDIGSVIGGGAGMKFAENPVARLIAGKAAQTADVASFDRLGKIWDAWRTLPEEIRALYAKPETSQVPLGPEAPPKEVLQASALYGSRPIPNQADALASVPVNGQNVNLRSAPSPESFQGPTPEGAGIPRTLAGDSALRQVLTGQDNATLLKIAKSRGINVTAESQLKPGVGDGRIINKIIDDFSPDELNELSAQYLENNRFRHSFGDIGPEAWRTMSLQTYFPDVKIPNAQLARTASAVNQSAAVPTPESPVSPRLQPPSADDLTDAWKAELARVQAAKAKKLVPAQ